MRAQRGISSLLAAVIFIAVHAMGAGSVPFRPDVAERLRSEGRLQQIVEGMENAIRTGLDRPPATARGWLARSDERSIPDRDAIVILVDFSDNPANAVDYPPAHYEAMLFSEGSYPTGSMRDWYLENSYGAFHVDGAVTVWLRMPQTYAYYVNGQAGFGAYPRNAQKLAEDAVAAADAIVDFSIYDNDGPDGIPDSGDDDGYVDALFVVHAGLGREETGSNNDIHSHAWAMPNPVSADGVVASSYSMEPDNGKRGVFGHEFGHVLGLPDLYDTDYSSSGVGDWCMMSFGSWGGGGLTPVHFLSWCKARLDFLDFTTPTGNLPSSSLPQVEISPSAHRLWTGGYPDGEYFTVENRQPILSDVSLPGSGLLICHVDEGASGNQDENHPLVYVEQADGLNELRSGGASDDGDPWPGSAQNRSFSDASAPDARGYDGMPSQVAVRNISNPGATMTADLLVESGPILVVEGFHAWEIPGNGDGDIDPGESWQMPLRLYNRGLGAANVSATISCDDPDVEIEEDGVSFGAIPAESGSTGPTPFLLALAPGSTDDGIELTVRIDDGTPPPAEFPVTVGIDDTLRAFRWSHAPTTEGYLDQWHLSRQRNHTPGGQYAWKCGARGPGPYADYLDSSLRTLPLPLATVRAFLFWHWMEAEDDLNGTAWDGGIVEASIDGGAWVQIAPDGGYPYTIIANPASPFEPGTPCFSGSFGWAQARFDLTGLAGELVELRLRFGSDGAVTREGWHIDDPSIEGALPSDAEGRAPLFDGSGMSVFPNPATSDVTIRFVQPAGSGASLSIFDITGRRLATRRFEAASTEAEREQTWHCRDIAGGAYLVRIETDRWTRIRRLLVIR